MPTNETGSLKPCQRQGLYITPFSTTGVRMPQMSRLLGQITVPSDARWMYRISMIGGRVADLDDHGRVAAVAFVLPVVGMVPPALLAGLGVVGEERPPGGVDQHAIDQIRRDVVAVLGRSQRGVVYAPDPPAVQVEADDDLGARPLHPAAARPVDELAVADRRRVAGRHLVVVHRRILLAVDRPHAQVNGPLGVRLGLEDLVERRLLIRRQPRRRDGRR